MSIQGEISIHIDICDADKAGNTKLHCNVISSRPTKAATLFTGKSIEETITTLPLLFSICANAQTITALRAIESATLSPISSEIESYREALISLESLREQSLRVLMDWPAHIMVDKDTDLNNAMLAHVSQGINQLIKSLKPEQIRKFRAKNAPALNTSHIEAWNVFVTKLEQHLFACTAKDWLDKDFNQWSCQQQTQAAQFIHWLNQQSWKQAGASRIRALPTINDNKLVEKLTRENNFSTYPNWQTHCFEVSWFTQHSESQNMDNGIYARMTGRLTEIARLINRLNNFFINKIPLVAPLSTARGLAHSNAARGRLTHYAKLNNLTIDQLIILAPTEWNFHPCGIVADSLTHLRTDTTKQLRQQAELVIHAIDPCVGYNLSISDSRKTLHISTRMRD